MKALLTIIAAAILIAAGTAHATDPQFERRIAEQDDRARFMADELERVLVRNAPLVHDEALSSYLNGVLVRLFDDHAVSMRIYVQRSAMPNAFVAPNGLIVLTTGLLARLDSESQLAMVLAHEGEHFLNRHVALNLMSAKINSAAGLVLGVAIGVPFAGQFLAATSYAGFSREVERAADESGYHRLRAAGYAGDDAHLFFARMEREAREMRRRDGSMFSSHPQLAERVATLRRLAAADGGNGDHGRERYLEVTASARMDALAELAAQRQARALILMFEEEAMLDRFPPAARAYLGEAYRMRGGEDDAGRAFAEFSAAAAADPGSAPAWRGIGLHYMSTGAAAEASAAFRRYLELAPAAADRAFIESFLVRLSAGGDV